MPRHRSSVGKTDAADADNALLAEAARFFAERQSYGVVWADSDLIVRRRFGPLVDFVALDQPLTASMIALLGFEDEIADLCERDGTPPLTIPNVIMNIGTEHAPRLSIDVYWAADQSAYLMLVRNSLDHSTLESELSTEMRLRAIAEAELLEKTKEIQRTNQELALANRDLEEFAYVISHDLKAPLRALRYDTADADRELTAGDMGAVRVRLSEMRRHEARMQAMLDGLFEYARIGRKDEVLEAVDTQALIDGIVAGMGSPSGMIVEVEGDWPRLRTLAAPLDLVLRNLVDNALKHNDAGFGRVTVTARDGGDTLDITVADNGPGIPREWQAAVFLPFRKVGEDQEQAESPGIGLALVRRTLDAVGGSVELQSDPSRQRGTTFLVRWPKAIGVRANPG